MLEGKKKKNCFKTTRQTGMEMQMRETENSKNQKSRRRVNRTKVKKTHLVIIPSPEDREKKGPNSSS